jgi:cation transport ATPase
MLFVDNYVLDDWLYRALVFLVISCPCALVISIPLGYFGGIGAASKNGILFKGSNFLRCNGYYSKRSDGQNRNNDRRRFQSTRSRF